jgi:small-conductance mechanosensitive channel
MMRTNNQSPGIFYPWLCLLFLVFISSSSLSANQESDDNWAQEAESSISEINTQLERFDIKRDNANILVEIEKKLSEYKIRAQKCVDEKSPQAEKLKADIAAIDGNSSTLTKGPATRSLGVLKELASKTEGELKICQTILLNTRNLADKAQALKSSILAEYLLSRGGNILATFQHNFESISPALVSLRDFVVTRVQITSFETYDWFIFLTAILAAWLAGVFLGKKLRRRAGQITSKGITGNLIAASYACLSQSLPLLLASVAASAVIASLLPLTPIPALAAFFASFTIYLLAILSARVLLHPCEPAKYFFVLNADFAYSLYKRLQFLLILGLLAMFAFSTSVKEIMTLPQWELARATFMALTIVNLVWLISYLNRAPGLLGNTLLRSLVSITLIVALAAELFGYRNLAGYLYTGTIGSILLGIALWLMYALLHDILDSLNEGRHRWGQNLRKKLQLQNEQSIPGLFWLRMLSVLIVWMFFVISMMQLWRYSDSGWSWFLSFLNEGFDVGNIRISPLQITLGIMLFAVLLTLVRWFRQNTLPKWVNTSNLDHGGREAVIAVSGYIGVLVSALIGLSVAGFDFTNLAIVAGALSVGIGFGLQNIVNNFVSGLILLFERPIRTGDWIVVGSTEGYVRKISIRSTQIETFDHADVIVPNSELIASQVTNWMLSDPWGRVIVPVGVAYGSDVRKVEQLLIDCAMEHPLVLKDNDRVNPPSVLFRGFGDSSLNFELRAFISQVDKRLSTLSDLNFAIEKALRENGVEIPFPQRDLHLRSMDPSITFTNRKPE